MEVIAKGNTAEIIRYDGGRICKLFFPGFPKAYIEHEYNNSELVYGMGINTPKAYGIVSIGGRDGIIYNEVRGVPLSRVMRDTHGQERKTWLLGFAELHREWLGHRVNSADNVMDYKDFLRLFLPSEPEAYHKLDALEDGDCLLHGDLHPGNIIVSPDGAPAGTPAGMTTGEPAGILTVIDMMNVCKGPAVYDIARTYFLLESSGAMNDKYLELMGYEQDDISPYYEIIKLAREKEAKI